MLPNVEDRNYIVKIATIAYTAPQGISASFTNTMCLFCVNLLVLSLWELASLGGRISILRILMPVCSEMWRKVVMRLRTMGRVDMSLLVGSC